MATLAFAGEDRVGRPVHRWMDMSAEERDATVGENGATGSLPQRLVRVSEKFLGTPYLTSPLGEGMGRDPDPLIRFDGVDCLTFVEETIALALGRSSAEVERVLTQIRYAEQPTFVGRNHLMEAQWIPNNVRKGFLRPATQRFAPQATREVWKTIDARSWSSPSARALGLEGAERPMGRFQLIVVGLDDLLAIAPQIDTGTILVVVREDRPHSPTRVSHVGFIVQKGRRTYLRHATRTFGRVVDEDLPLFIARNAKYDRWKVVGASLFDVVRLGERPVAAGTAPELPR